MQANVLLFEKLMVLLQVMKLNKLHCRVIKWADERTANPDLRNYFRFTVLKSRKIGDYIYQLISILQTDNDTRQQQLMLHALSATMAKLREIHKRNIGSNCYLLLAKVSSDVIDIETLSEGHLGGHSWHHSTTGMRINSRNTLLNIQGFPQHSQATESRKASSYWTRHR